MNNTDMVSFLRSHRLPDEPPEPDPRSEGPQWINWFRFCIRPGCSMVMAYDALKLQRIYWRELDELTKPK